ncbi:ABC transporter ATP-binding protein [Nonomuraea sp. NPDC026600]|uniref:ABC transporter ATP-binding protein n=1 Tax=Nonomuraea sp. NPDC026600 TaxID=3155363 RepID=UPI0033DCEDC7
MLQLADMDAGYGRSTVLHGLSLTVGDGEFVVMLGANGAGKTATIRAINGVISRTGTVMLDGSDISEASVEQIVRRGVAQVPQGRGTFPELTVAENLRAGGYVLPKSQVAGEMDKWYDMFPKLAERRSQRAGTLSGGEQQMLAIARALMSRPKILLCDEPSLGLAPRITRGFFDVLHRLNKETGLSVFLVEQNANLAMSFADRVYVLETGRIVADGPAHELSADDTIRKAYLGF